MNILENIITLLGLILNLIFNFFTNREILAPKSNKIVYFIVWMISAFFLLISKNFSNNSAELLSIFYVAVGFSFPQIAIYLLKIGDLEVSKKKIIDDLEVLQKEYDSHYSMVLNKLVAVDVPEAKILYRAGQTIEELQKLYLQKSDDYIKYGLLASQKRNEYICSVLYIVLTSAEVVQ